MAPQKRTRTALLVATGAVLIVAGAIAAGKQKMDAQLLTVGTSAPAFTLPDQDGTTHSLAADKGKVVLLAFYPADGTSGCTIEAHSLTAAHKDLQALGVTTYGVSVQDSNSHKQFCTKEGIPYTLLADTQRQASKEYGVLIPAANIANRVTYIIGRDGKVAYVDKDVNSHVYTCGDDWVKWLKAHPQVTGSTGAATAAASDVTPGAGLQLASATTAPAALGAPAPTFALPNVATGTTTSLASLSTGKKATVLMFIATQCPVSNAYNTRMEALATQYGPKGVAFAGINSNKAEAVSECAAHARTHHFTFPVLKDAGNKVADSYDARFTPTVYVLDAQGKLVYHGRIDNAQDPADVQTHELADALDAVLAGQPVAKPETKAFGCTIKRVGA